jgi:hypothetical protein
MQAAFDNMQLNNYHVGRGYGTVAAFVYPTIRPSVRSSNATVLGKHCSSIQLPVAVALFMVGTDFVHNQPTWCTDTVF